MLFKKSVYKILCKGATGGKETYTLLQEYVMDSILNKTEDMLDINEDVICNNVIYKFERMKARNEKQADLILNKLIDEELSLYN